MPDPSSPVNDGAELWQQLQDRYGLDPEGYDRDLADEMRSRLGLPSGDMASLISAAKIPVEELLHAVLTCLGPFSGMLTDLLRLYELAAAARADHPNLQIVYDFGAERPLLDFDLDTFKKWVETTCRVAVDSPVRRWTTDQLWVLWSTVRRPLPEEDADAAPSAQIGAWLGIYDDGQWPSSPPALPLTGHAELDVQLRRCRVILDAVVGRCRQLSASPGELRDRFHTATADDTGRGSDLAQELQTLVFLDADGWASQMLRALDRITSRAAVVSDMDLSLVAGDLATLMDGVPAISVEVETVLPVLSAMLSLPAWQRRHELYSAWALTQIVDSAGPKLVRVHTTLDGKLSFSFAGSHVATIESPVHGSVFVWAELRSPLASPSSKRRRNNIQPDYTLLTAPVTAPSSALVVLECKQYRKASPDNFGSALRDYAAGRPQARVLLMNYGPAADTVLQRVRADDRARCFVLPRVRPDEAAQQQRLRELIREALGLDPAPAPVGEAVASARPQERPGSAWATIRLEWGQYPRDLDLHVLGRRENDGDWWRVGYSSLGSLATHPFAQLDGDVTAGGGPETVTVTRPATLRIEVQQYSNDGTLAGSEARLRIVTPVTDVTITCPDQGWTATDKAWHAADVSADGTVRSPAQRCAGDRLEGHQPL